MLDTGKEYNIEYRASRIEDRASSIEYGVWLLGWKVTEGYLSGCLRVEAAG
ncbi:MAG: hypothetical protein AB1797_06670 [bacterium]